MMDSKGKFAAAIVVVEDEAKYYNPLIEYLRKFNFSPIHIRMWSELNRIVHGDVNFDLVMLDLLLTSETTINKAIESIALIRRIRPFLPIIVLTQHARPPWLDLAKNAGANDVIMKPPEITIDYLDEILLPKIKEQLEKANALDYDQALRSLKKLKEDDLINQLIVPLFQSMDYSRVRAIDHHGAGEFGMDILPFYKVNEFGERHYYAVQVKAVDINTKPSSNGNINSVINQAESALKKAFLDEDNQKRLIDRAFIITSGHITPDAQAIITDYLDGNRKIALIDGNRLLGLLRSYNLINNLRTLIPVRSIKIIPYLIENTMSVMSYWDDIMKQILYGLAPVMNFDAGKCYHTLMKRELMMPTVVGDSFAIPHATELELEEHVVFLCAAQQSCIWTEFYDRLVSFTIVFLSPEGRDHDTVHKIMDTIRILVGGLMKNPDHYNMKPNQKLIYVTNSIMRELKRFDFKVAKEKVRKIEVK